MARHRERAKLMEPLESRFLLATGELIRNGSFEGAAAGADWNVSGLLQADSRFTNVHSGLGYAYLSNTDGSAANNISGSMYQQVVIPSSATELKLSFWTKITTSETTTSTQNDLLTVRIMDATGANVLHSAATLSNLNSSSSYVRREYTLPLSLKGQTVRVQFNGSTNASLTTTFRVDDVGLSTRAPDLSKRVVGYLPSYRQSSFANVDLNMVTHLNYFSVSVTSSGAISSGLSDTSIATVLNAAHAKGVGVSITVGPQSFAAVAADSGLRATFASNIKYFISARNLDGVDIDWEPPATGTNQANYALLIDELYKQLSPLGLKITAAVNPWTKEIPVAATNQMDWVNVMCYDFDYANNSTYAAATDGMNQWTSYGVAKDKLVMGSPFYGRWGTSWSDTHSKTYSGILTDYKALNGAYPSFDTDSYVDAAGKTTFFNGVTTMQKKSAFVRDNGLGGMMIWELGQDHWDGSNKYDAWSLLPVINSMLRPPAWASPASGSRFNYLNNSFKLDFGSVTFIGDAGASTNITTAAATSATFTASQKLASLTLSGSGSLSAGGAKSLVVNTISFTGAGQLNLNDNGMIVRSMSRASVEQLVDAGYGTGNWQGAGIMSSFAANVAAATSLGVARADDLGYTSFSGRTVSGTDVLVKYTWKGDANLDGVANPDDFTALVAGMGGAGSRWVTGDFDFSGFVDPDDFTSFIAGLSAFDASGGQVL